MQLQIPEEIYLASDGLQNSIATKQKLTLTQFKGAASRARRKETDRVGSRGS